MPQTYTPEFKKKIVRCLIWKKDVLTKASPLSMAYQKPASLKWCAEFSEECQTKAILNPESPNEVELMKENLRLRKALHHEKRIFS